MLNRRPVPVQCCCSMNLYHRSPGVDGWFPWFRNGIPQSRAHPWTLQNTCHLVWSSSLPCSMLERKIGSKTGKDHRLRYEQFLEKNSEIREWTVTAMILMTECTGKEMCDSHYWSWLEIPDHSLLHITSPRRKPFPLPQKMMWGGRE